MLEGDRLRADAPFEHTTITGRGRLRTALQGPDGDLDVATDADPRRICRITPTS